MTSTRCGGPEVVPDWEDAATAAKLSQERAPVDVEGREASKADSHPV